MKFQRLARAFVICFAAMALTATASTTAYAAGQNPVLVIGGFDADRAKIDSLTSWLTSMGHPAYALELGRATGVLKAPTGSAHIADSAQAVASMVTSIRQRTGAARVDVVGHSMGGLAQRHFLKYLGGSAEIGTYVDLGTPEQGDTLGALCLLLYPGCQDLTPGSAFLNHLNTTPPIPAGVPAYHFFSENGTGEKHLLPGATNASIQSFCPGRFVDHADEPVDAAARQLIDAALQGVHLDTSCAA
jgi:triacylglycerol lipase